MVMVVVWAEDSVEDWAVLVKGVVWEAEGLAEGLAEGSAGDSVAAVMGVGTAVEMAAAMAVVKGEVKGEEMVVEVKVEAMAVARVGVDLVEGMEEGMGEQGMGEVTVGAYCSCPASDNISCRETETLGEGGRTSIRATKCKMRGDESWRCTIHLTLQPGGLRAGPCTEGTTSPLPPSPPSIPPTTRLEK